MRLRPVVAVALAALAVFCVRGECETSALELAAVAASVSGNVEAMKPGSGEWQKLNKGDSLKSGDSVKTGPDGKCTIMWAQGNVVTLEPYTKMTLDAIRAYPGKDKEEHRLSIEKGRMYAKVRKLSGYSSTFEIATPTAVAGVRGTRLATEVADDGTTTVECHTGNVVVVGLSGGETVLRGGDWTQVKKGARPTDAKPLDADKKKAFDSAEGMGTPSLTLLDPLGDMKTAESFLVIHGRTDPGAGVSVDGNAVDVSESGFFTALVMDLKEGKNTIVIKATGQGGQAVEKTLAITYSASAGSEEEAVAAAAAAESGDGAGFDPGAEIDVAVIYPPDGFVTRKSEITLTGKKTPGTKLLINGAEDAATPGARTFIKKILLEDEGASVYTFTVTRGNESKTISYRITRDTTPPMLEIFRPAGSQFDIMSGDCTLNGLYSDGDFAYCNIAGMTEADATLVINDLRYEVASDGSFDNQVALKPRDAVVLVAAEDEAGNRTIKVLTRLLQDMDETVYMTVSVSPSQITGDNVSTAVITVTCLNYLGQPIDGILVNVDMGACMMANCGSLSSPVVALANGSGTVTYTAGIADVRTDLTFTATSGTKSGSATLLLLPDAPVVLER